MWLHQKKEKKSLELKLIKVQEKDKFTISVTDFNSSLSIYRINRKKTHVTVRDLNNATASPDGINILRHANEHQ